jgi:uncharacterized protein YndB with AHSA1/START domain
MPASPAKASSAVIVTTPSDREIVLTRVFDAPRRLVFEALSRPEHVLRWFGPHSCPIVECEMDFRVGGAWRYILRGADGRNMGMRGVYREIQAPERLVSTEAYDDYPGESLNTVTLTEENGKTTLTTRVLYESKETRDAVIRSGMEQGAGETYDRLADQIRTMEPELVITRVFDAPRELVFECWTEPEHLQHWQGAPRGFTVTSYESDIRPGGFFRICMRSPEGVDSWLEGGYREIAKPERLVFTHVWLDANKKPGKQTLVSISLSERDGKTELMLRQTGFPSVESRDGHGYGWNSALSVLTDYLAETSNWAARSIVVTRVFDAPRNLVFDAWTDSRHVGNWYGPRGFTLTTYEMDVRPGGVWRFTMHGPDGVDYPNKITYIEIAKPERLVYDHGGAGARVTVTFLELGGKTELTMRMLFRSVEERDLVVKTHNAIEGANQTLDRFGEQLKKMQELIATRVFDAPREVVFRAWTDPERLQRWWGPKGFTNPVCQVDVRPGGAIRIDMRAPDGIVYPMTGVFHEIIEPERLVFTSSALDQNGEPLFEVLNTVTFAEESGKTRLTVHASVSKVRAEAAQHLAGMELGWSMTLDRLEEEVGR